MAAADDELREITLHGHRVFFRSAGSGPALVLVHGITSTSATWANVLPYLAERFTVIAPDLLGHGESAKPRGDYSLGAYASGIRDLLLALGHDRATFVGHSLGGGVAMQLAYQFPEHCERLVLVSSGGLGREISALLRAASLPGSELVLPFLVDDRRRGRRPARRAPARPHRAARAHRRRRGPARPRVALRRRGARGVPAHPEADRRRPGPAGRCHATASTSPSRSRSSSSGASATRSSPSSTGARAHRLVAGQPARGLPRRGPLPASRRPAALRARAGRLHRHHRAVAGRRRPLGQAAARAAPAARQWRRARA